MKTISLVTGASSGLGKEIAKLLCAKSHKIYVTARRKNLLEELKKDCANLNGEIIVFSGDLSDASFRKKLILTIIKKEKKIDFLFNNAGFGRAVKFENQNSKEIQKMNEVNVVAYEHLTGLALPFMKKRNSGRIINIGSVVVFTPLPYFTVYNATKSAVYSFTRSLRYELKGSKVTSTIVLPARMKTGFAEIAYDCYKKYGKEVCIARFNKIAGSPYKVAKVIVKKMDKGKKVITPTLKSKLWYFMKHFEGFIDLIMKNSLGPKELKHLESAKLNPEYSNK
tara:strand:+ start:159 stop:1001 length:843 start_codon:yes stop_codon:yes gene_type:complete